MQANKYWFKILAIMFALFLFSTSCVEEYWPELKANNDQLLVIDGKITNFPGPYTVKLSFANTINEAVKIPLSSATVFFIDNLGNQELLNETNPGIYVTREGGMQGIVGRSYKIKIQLNSGKIYESALEELKKPVEVESVSVEETIRVAKNALETDQPGYQFYVSSKRAESARSYYYWEIEETYEYHSDYNIIFLYDGKHYDSTKFNPYGMAQTVNADTLRFCWKTQNVNERFIYSTEYLSIPVVNKKPIHFIPFTDERLRQKYCILVKQYSISEDAYTFMDKLDKQNNNQDALFTTQPFQVRGNVFNLDDPTEPVLGYFLIASGTYGPRLFAKAPSRIRWDRTLCAADTTVAVIRSNMNLNASPSHPIYFTVVSFENPNPSLGAPLEVMAYVRQDCLDCERQGGVAVKPEYWDW